MNTQRSSSFPKALALLAIALCVLATALLGVTRATAAEPAASYQTVSELEGKTIAYINGSVYGLAVAERVDGTKEAYYPSLPDCVAAVQSGKADAACGISYCCELAVNRSNGAVAMVPELVKDVDEAFFAQKGNPLLAEFDEVLDRLRADGTLDELAEKWVAASDEGKTLPEQDWDAPNGTIKFATSGVLEPFSYTGPNGVAYGYDVELAMLIAKELGYHIETQMIAMDSIFAAVESGKVDIGGTLTVTPERQEMVDFTQGVMDVGIGLIVAADGNAAAGGPEYTSLDELANKRFGNLNGSTFVDYIEEYVPAHGEILSYNTTAELATALSSNKIDAFICDEPTANLLVARNSGITMFPEKLEETDYGFFFPKGSSLVDEVNPVIEGLWEDGTVDGLNEKWIMSGDEFAKVLPEQDWDAPNGTITMATTGLYEPMSYTGPGGDLVGYDIELALLIAKELGYRLELTSFNIDGVIMAVQAGKTDFGGTGTTITEERAEIVDFSDPIYHGSVVLVVREASADASVGDFLAGIRESFERTFITEDRWRMVLSGLGITLLITAAASALGSALGFALTLARRKSALADRVVSGFQTLMSGLPIVVVLMLLYYVVFGSIDIPGALVAILGFALNFAATFSSNAWNAVKAMDAGQEEAALALGYTKGQSFRKVVLPQAARQFLPLHLGQMVSLVKETSIVGYIAVADLTRASDLIRSRTMEAFFPLIATAVIYFLICWILRRVGTHLIERWDPENKPRTIEGVSM